MNIEKMKATLEAIDHPVTSDTMEDMIEELHLNHRQTQVGTSLTQLGMAKPLYVINGNVGHLVDNPEDLHRACVVVDQLLQEAKAKSGPIVVKQDVHSRHLSDVSKAVELEVDMRNRLGRMPSFIADNYQVQYDPDLRKQTRIGAQIVRDMLSTDGAISAKGSEAFRLLMVLDS